MHQDMLDAGVVRLGDREMTATYEEFRSDDKSEHIWIAEISYYDTETDTTGTLYYSTAPFGTDSGDTPSSQLFEARLLNGYNFTATAPQIGAFGGLLPPREGGSLLLAQNMGDLDGLRFYSFDGRSIIIRHGGYSPSYGQVAYADFATVFDGEGDGQVLVGVDTVTLKLRNKDARFEFPIQDRHYSGGRYWMYFDGTNDRINGGHAGDTTDTGLNFVTSSFTAEFWIYIEANPGGGVDATLLSRGLVGTNGWVVRLDTSGRIVGITSQGGASQSSVSTAVPLKKRTHVAVSRSGTAISIYIDGVLSMSSSATHTDPTTSGATFYVGQNNSGTVFFNGFIDELRIWNEAKGINEINSKKDRQLTSSEASVAALQLYYKFDDGTGDTVTDSSSYAIDGDITTALGTWFTSLQGNEDLTGSVLPDVWGQRNGGYAPILVDEPRMVYQIHSGPIYELTSVYVGGVVIDVDSGGTSGGVYTSMFGFLSHSTTPGKYARLITDYGSWFKLGSQPNKPVTLSVKGDYTGGVYVDTVGEIVRRIICLRGPQPLTDPTDLDTASFTQIETDATYTVGDGYSDDMTIAEVIGFLLASVGAVGWFEKVTGKFAVKVFSSAELDIDIDEEPVAIFRTGNVQEDSLEPIDVGAPVWGIDLNYRHNDVIHQTTDVAASLIGDTVTDSNFWRFLMNEWRTCRPRNGATRVAFKGATILPVDTAIQFWPDAVVESNRLLNLYQAQGQCFRGFFDRSASLIDRMDKVVFHFEDINSIGELQSRLGTSESSVFLVLAVEDDAENGGTWLTLYREAIA